MATGVTALRMAASAGTADSADMLAGAATAAKVDMAASAGTADSAGMAAGAAMAAEVTAEKPLENTATGSLRLAVLGGVPAAAEGFDQLDAGANL
jgi:hypothetical protein